MRVLLVLLFLAGLLGAQEPRVSSLGLGRSRLEFDLQRRSPVRPGTEGRIELGRLGFRERWLQRELPRLVPGLESVAVVERIQARSSTAGLAAARDRVLELVGPDEAVRQADARLRQLAAAESRRLRARAWVVALTGPGAGGRSARLETLGEEALARRLAELAQSEGAQIIETAELEFGAGEEGRIAVGNRLDYRRDQRIAVAAGRLFAEPIMDTVQEGLRWSLGALFDPATDRLHLDTDFVFARAARPFLRLEGRLGAGGEPLLIERPIVAETRWDTSGLVLAPGELGFRICDLEAPSPDTATESGRLEILCQIEVLDPAESEEGGLVQGYDSGAGLAFVLIDEGARVPGDQVLFLRAGKRIGEGRVEEVLGKLITVKVAEGRPRFGDHLR